MLEVEIMLKGTMNSGDIARQVQPSHPLLSTRVASALTDSSGFCHAFWSNL